MADGITLAPASGGPKLKTEESADGQHYVRLKVADGTADSDVVIASGNGEAENALRVTLASDSTGLVKLAESSAVIGESGVGAASTGAGDLAKREDAAYQEGDTGIAGLGVRKDTPEALSGADGDYEPLQVSGGRAQLSVTGSTADDAAASGNPLLAGGVFDEASAVIEADAAQLQVDQLRRARVATAHPDGWRATDNQSTAQTQTELVAAGSSQIMVSSVSVSAAAAQTIQLLSNGVGIVPPIYVPANGQQGIRFKQPVPAISGANLSYTSTANVGHSVTVTGYRQKGAPVSSGIKIGLEAWWSFDEASGTRADSVGSIDLPDTSSVASVAGLVSNAADFSGSNAFFYNSSVTPIRGARDFTVAAWLYFDSLTGDITPLILRNVGGAEWALQHDGGAMKFYMANAAVSYSAVSASSFGALSTGTWYWVLAEHDIGAGTMGISINNGTLDTAAAPVTYNVGDSLGVGYWPAVGRYLNGRIDETAFWSRKLTPAEKAFIYNSGAGISFASLP